MNNEQQLKFATYIETRAAKIKLTVNNFLNPNWTEDYGSGGNVEGHLLMMRREYYIDEFVNKIASNRVMSIKRSMNKKAKDKSNDSENDSDEISDNDDSSNNASKSKYNINKDSSIQEIDAEIERVKGELINDWEPNWFPS